MGWFNRKSKVEEVKPQKPVCNHKYKDFPWFYEARYNTSTRELSFKVWEPFVCIHCKERINKLLYERNSHYKTYEEADDYVTQFREKYADRMEEEVVVEDMIADMQLVDRDYLLIAETLLKVPADKLLEPFKLKI
jgi:hypothetical protein